MEATNEREMKENEKECYGHPAAVRIFLSFFLFSAAGYNLRFFPWSGTT